MHLTAHVVPHASADQQPRRPQRQASNSSNSGDRRALKRSLCLFLGLLLGLGTLTATCGALLLSNVEQQDEDGDRKTKDIDEKNEKHCGSGGSRGESGGKKEDESDDKRGGKGEYGSEGKGESRSGEISSSPWPLCRSVGAVLLATGTAFWVTVVATAVTASGGRVSSALCIPAAMSVSTVAPAAETPTVGPPPPPALKSALRFVTAKAAGGSEVGGARKQHGVRFNLDDPILYNEASGRTSPSVVDQQTSISAIALEEGPVDSANGGGIFLLIT